MPVIPTGLRGLDAHAEVTVQMVPVHEAVHAGTDLAGAARRLVEVCRDTVPGCDAAGLTEWPLSGEPRGVATTDPATYLVDDLQCAHADGPWAFAPVSEGFVHIEDVEYDRRWPVFAEAVVVQTAIRSMLSYRFPIAERRLTLNLYAEHAAAFDVEAVALARSCATQARTVLLHLATATARTGSVVPESGKVVGTAVGLLVGREGVTAEQAYLRLLEQARRSRRRLHEVAREIIAAAPAGGARG